jgi:predicted PurR-regulated permease PerM
MAEPVLEPIDALQGPAGVPPPRAPSRSTVTGLIAAAVVIAALYFASEILIPMTLAVLLSFVLSPLMELLRRVWVPRVLAALLAVVIAIGIILALGGIIGTQLAGLAGQVPQYQYTIERKVNAVQELIANQLASRISFITNHLQNLGGLAASRPAQAPQHPAAAATGAPAPAQKPVPVIITQSPTSSALDLAERVLRPVLHPLATLGIILVVTIFILLQKEDLRDRLIRLFGADDLHRATLAMDDAGRRLTRYFLSQLCVNCGFGLTIGMGLFILGVPGPLLWGILAGLLRFVPYIGVYLAAALPVMLAAAVGYGWSTALWTALLYVLTDVFISQAIEPTLYGHSTGLSPFSVIVAAIFWAWIWGPIGLILSTPMTVCLVVLGRHVESLEFLEVLLGDRPALTPIENFYQRLLAGDPNEAEEHAERFLADHSLTEYYDEVALKGLRMAAADARRGALSAARLERMRDVVTEMVHDLADNPDAEPALRREAEPGGYNPFHRRLGRRQEVAGHELSPEWSQGTPILCVPARGILDEAAAAMLVQLLGKHGIAARIVPYRMASQSEIDTADQATVAIVCVIRVEITGNPVHLRTLVRRLRNQMPDSRILVGFWAPEDTFLRDRGARAQMGADLYVASLREAEEACVAVARSGSPGAQQPRVVAPAG